MGQKKSKYTLLPLINAIISFCHKITLCYENQRNILPENTNEAILNKLKNLLDLSKITSDEIFYKLMINIYKLLNEAIGLIVLTCPEIAFKLYVLSASQANEILIEKEKFSESCAAFINNALAILKEKYGNNNRLDLIENLASSFIHYSIFDDKKKQEIVQTLITICENLKSREEQFKSMLIISQLYYSLFKNGKKVMECIGRARRFTDFAMTSPQNLYLFVDK